jgi:micrococcal nuclease
MIAIINNMNKKKGVILISLISLLLFVIDYSFIDEGLGKFLDEKEFTIVSRIIDGDTIVVGNDTHVRLLGINTPEKGEEYYNEAKLSLAKLMNKTVQLEYTGDRIDKYGRTLAYVIFEDNVNIEQVKNGFANFYIYGFDKYSSQLKEAWNECLAKGKNLCEKSKDKCANCIELKSIKNQTVKLVNNCGFNCNLTNWQIKDEGRKKFVFENYILEEEVSIIVGNETNTEERLFWKREDYVWTEGGDTFFLRDSQGKLVLWKEINR